MNEKDFDKLIDIVEKQALLINGIMKEFKKLQGVVAHMQFNLQRLEVEK
jgi:hypothetical protein